ECDACTDKPAVWSALAEYARVSGQAIGSVRVSDAMAERAAACIGRIKATVHVEVRAKADGVLDLRGLALAHSVHLTGSPPAETQVPVHSHVIWSGAPVAPG